MALDAEIKTWKGFRDALRIDEREIFDDLMDLARERASAGGASTRYVITEAMFMTLIFQHHRLLRKLENILAGKETSTTPSQSRLDKEAHNKNDNLQSQTLKEQILESFMNCEDADFIKKLLATYTAKT